MPDSPRPTDSAPTRPPESGAETAQVRRAGPDSPRRLNGWVIALVCLIIGGAFAISADSWVRLAESAGFTTRGRVESWTLRLAWVLPVVVDSYTALATWLYLGARPGTALRTFAGRAAFASAGLSVLAQSAYHGLAAGGIVVAEFWPLVVLVGAIPPVLLASAIHLLATYLHDHRPVAVAPPELSRPPCEPEHVAAESTDSPAESRTGSVPVASRPAAAPTRLALVPVRIDSAESADSAQAIQIDDDELRRAIRPYVAESRRRGVEPGQREMVRIVRESTGASVGQKRCVRVAETIQAEDDHSDDDQEDTVDRDPIGATA